MSGEAITIPAVSVALVNNGSVLLVRRAREPSKGFWAFPGGRVEIGETLEHAARRELKEETGLEVGPLTLCARVEIEAVQGIFQLHVFRAEYAGGHPVAADDAEEARWIRLGEIGELPVTESTQRVAHTLLGGE